MQSRRTVRAIVVCTVFASVAPFVSMSGSAQAAGGGLCRSLKPYASKWPVCQRGKKKKADPAKNIAAGELVKLAYNGGLSKEGVSSFGGFCASYGRATEGNAATLAKAAIDAELLENDAVTEDYLDDVRSEIVELCAR